MKRNYEFHELKKYLSKQFRNFVADFYQRDKFFSFVTFATKLPNPQLERNINNSYNS